jgi:pimeloyl-ACP methyl ester carboxylesterase
MKLPFLSRPRSTDAREKKPSFAARVAARAASALDEAFLTVIDVEGSRQAKHTISKFSHEERVALLGDIARVYEADGLFDSFVGAPPLPAPRVTLVSDEPGAFGRAQRTRTLDLSWESAWVVRHDGVRAKFESRVPNRTAHARLISGGERRPAVVVIHGYMGGQWAFEERQWQVGALLRAGLDVALFTLPFHAKRSDRVGIAPIFPSGDPRFNNEAFGQAASDARALVAHLLEAGSPAVGVMGVSLGGYLTSLLATVEPRLAFAAPIIPLASLADFAQARGRLGESDAEATVLHGALERATRIVSPLARPLLVPKECVLVVAAEGDRVTPVAHARRIAEHFGADLHLLAGGHLLQLDRKDGLRAVVQMLRREGLISPRAPGPPSRR